jgi:hypothetical protein
MGLPGATGETRPGFLVVEASDDGTYVGGLMVTDAVGLPLDFRFTDPITPTRLQRALYGGALDRYLRADVVAATLLKAVEERPTVLLVQDDELLDLPDAPAPVALVTASRSPSLGAPGATRAEAEDRALLQLADGISPARVSVRDPQQLPAAVSALTALGERMDPFEPSERVRAALALIAAGETV